MSAKQIAALQERAKLKSCSEAPIKIKHSVEGDTSNYFDLCICNRQPQDILCRSCGYIFVGRHRRQCSLHPNEILLMDYVVCPKCRTDSLLEIKTSKTPVKHKQDEIITELAHLRQRRCSKDEKSTRHTSISSSGDEEKGNNFYGSFSLSKNEKNCEMENEIARQPVPQLQSPNIEGDGGKLEDLKGIRSQSSFDKLKSLESKTVGISSTYDIASSSKARSSEMNHLRGPHSVKSNDRLNMLEQSDNFDNERMPLLEPSFASENQSISFSGQILAPANNRMPFSERFTTPVNSRMLLPVQDKSCGIGRMPLFKQTPQPSISQMPLPVQAKVPSKDKMSLSGQVSTQTPQINTDKPEKNLVSTEVQTDFVFQGLQESIAYNQTVQAPVKEATFDNRYKYEPRKAVGGEKENNILRAAIRRSNTEGWNKGLDRMNDMCIGDRRY